MPHYDREECPYCGCMIRKSNLRRHVDACPQRDNTSPRDTPRDQLDDPWNAPGAPFRNGDY